MSPMTSLASAYGQGINDGIALNGTMAASLTGGGNATSNGTIYPAQSSIFTHANLIGMFLTLEICLYTQPAGSLLFYGHQGGFAWRMNPISCLAETLLIWYLYGRAAVRYLRHRMRFGIEDISGDYDGAVGSFASHMATVSASLLLLRGQRPVSVGHDSKAADCEEEEYELRELLKTSVPPDDPESSSYSQTVPRSFVSPTLASPWQPVPARWNYRRSMSSAEREAALVVRLFRSGGITGRHERSGDIVTILSVILIAIKLSTMHQGAWLFVLWMCFSVAGFLNMQAMILTCHGIGGSEQVCRHTFVELLRDHDRFLKVRQGVVIHVWRMLHLVFWGIPLIIWTNWRGLISSAPEPSLLQSWLRLSTEAAVAIATLATLSVLIMFNPLFMAFGDAMVGLLQLCHVRRTILRRVARFSGVVIWLLLLFAILQFLWKRSFTERVPASSAFTKGGFMDTLQDEGYSVVLKMIWWDLATLMSYLMPTVLVQHRAWWISNHVRSWIICLVNFHLAWVWLCMYLAYFEPQDTSKPDWIDFLG